MIKPKSFLLSLSIFIHFTAIAQVDKQAAEAFIKRIVPSHAGDFLVSEIPPDSGRDVFELESRDGKIILGGNKGLSIAAALSYYLKTYCHDDFGWNGENMHLPDTLPPVPQKIHQPTPYKYRYYFNYTAFGYSMCWWNWGRWQKEIDLMALNGINMPLALTGEEAVWQKVYKDMGLSDKDLNSFFTGPAYLPWLWLGNLDGWGGPLPQHWIDSHKELQQKILERERSFGMTPVLPAFNGYIPTAFKAKFPQHKFTTTNWGQGFGDKYLLNADDSLFTIIGKKFLDAQTEVYGTDHFYAADTFDENTPVTDDSTYISGMSKQILAAMTVADSKSVWVLSGSPFHTDAHFWKKRQLKALLDAVPDNQMIVIDMTTDEADFFRDSNTYAKKPWIYGTLQNYGGNNTVAGRMEQDAGEFVARGGLSKSMVGYGILPEGIEQNPAIFELTMDQGWRTKQIDYINWREESFKRESNKKLKSFNWLEDYIERRYGKSNPGVYKAWLFLLKSVYITNFYRQGPASIITGRPSFHMMDDNWHVDTLTNYYPGTLVNAWALFVQSADQLKNSDGFRYDLVDITRQVLADYANILQPKIMNAYALTDTAGFKRYSGEFLQLLDDMDELLSTRQDFLLGKWLSDARANGIATEESDLYEFNARDLITLWGDKNSPMHEYSNRHWGGLIKGFYKPRWEAFFEGLNQSLINHGPFDINCYQSDVKDWEWYWVHQHDQYPTTPIGNSVDVAVKLYKKYSGLLSQVYP